MCVRMQTPWHVWAVGLAFFMFVLSGLAFHYANLFQLSSINNFAVTVPTVSESEGHHWFTMVWALALWTSLIGAALILMQKQYAFAVLALALTASAISLAFSLDASTASLQSMIYLFFRVAAFLGLGFVALYAREMENLYVFR